MNYFIAIKESHIERLFKEYTESMFLCCSITSNTHINFFKLSKFILRFADINEEGTSLPSLYFALLNIASADKVSDTTGDAIYPKARLKKTIYWYKYLRAVLCWC